MRVRKIRNIYVYFGLTTCNRDFKHELKKVYDTCPSEEWEPRRKKRLTRIVGHSEV